ncbi:hypothetical protein [Klebsiella variicola]|uniref:hypothetical protein n=1 Tax=Klebsiella variicola TaxID=244366 RepID=UPI0026599980|nr:hypothetical protein [Klebsiella variicola]WKH03374.1 hypothetical protein QYQ59_06310 [Klebsiella variicola]
MKSLYLALGLMTLSPDHPRRFFIARPIATALSNSSNNLLRQNQQQRESLERATPSLHAAMPCAG